MKNPMQAFVGKDFDCQFWTGDIDHSSTQIGYLQKIRPFADEYHYSLITETASICGFNMCRPRINKPQVLDDYSDIALIKDFVWVVRYSDVGNTSLLVSKPLRSGFGLIGKFNTFGKRIASIEFIGVEKGSDLEEWAKANDVPIIDINGGDS